MRQLTLINLIPFDIWFHITLHCSTDSLLNLRGVCTIFALPQSAITNRER